MEAHTPKRFAVEKFIGTEHGRAHGWEVRVVDEQDSPTILLEATGPQGTGKKTLELHSRQVTLTNEQLDPSTQKMISRWLESLESGQSTPAPAH